LRPPHQSNPHLVSALTRTDGSVAPAILRLTLAAVVFPHGAQLLGWFGGYGFTGTMASYRHDGHPVAAGLRRHHDQFFGSLLLVVGAGTGSPRSALAP
jgi:putative oxidoreductase